MEADLAAAHAVAEAALVVEDPADQWEEDPVDRWAEDPMDRWEEDLADQWEEDPMDQWAVHTDLGADRPDPHTDIGGGADGIARITLTAVAVACP